MFISKGLIWVGIGITGLVILLILGIITLATSRRRKRKFIMSLHKSYESNEYGGNV